MATESSDGAEQVWLARNAGTGRVLATRIVLAGSSQARRLGLMGRTSLGVDEGLWIFPSEAIHTFGMKIPIDVVFLDKSNRVTAIRHRLRPNRIAVSLSATSVLELASGVLARAELSRGDALQLVRSDRQNVEGVNAS
jgi:uncharacterized protein